MLSSDRDELMLIDAMARDLLGLARPTCMSEPLWRIITACKLAILVPW